MALKRLRSLTIQLQEDPLLKQKNCLDTLEQYIYKGYAAAAPPRLADSAPP